MKQTLNAAAVS